MALRDSSDSGEIAKVAGASAVAGLPAYWDSKESAAKIKWVHWWNLFMVPVNAKYTISVDELLRNVTEQKPRNAALINNLNEQAAERKLASLLFLTLGMAQDKV